MGTVFVKLFSVWLPRKWWKVKVKKKIFFSNFFVLTERKMGEKIEFFVFFFFVLRRVLMIL